MGQNRLELLIMNFQSPKSVPTTDEIPPTNPKRTRRKLVEPAEPIQASRDTTEDVAERLRRVALSLHLGNREGITAALAEAGAVSGGAAAFAQIEALTGSRDTVMYFRAVKKLKK